MRIRWSEVYRFKQMNTDADEPYVPEGNARFAYLNLNDPFRPDPVAGWVTMHNIEAQRGRWQGSDGADFQAGLIELVEHGWAEYDEQQDAYRITAHGHVLRGRLGLT